ncbi:hypothetical protein [Rhodococcus sp. PD04]|uniref:hypothetical protein n=1 Tax=Rhodococcus sp. PD04 TaxID=3109594 RepID=UPI002DD7F2EF|nr:hypothetical protein [Rhodococcus sp. PD04]WSE22329.1 hypothetical protein U9J23_22185 [Rhodococcus sp. PD04]
MSETIVRHRTGGFDDDGDPIPVSDPELELVPLGIAPGATADVEQLGRHGESVAFTVYLRHGSDVVDGDELEIRGKRYRARVNVWRSQRRANAGGLEVFATLGRG